MNRTEADAYRKDKLEKGWFRITENGGELWTLYRGSRWAEKIVAVEIDPDGMSLWVKSEEPKNRSK